LEDYVKYEEVKKMFIEANSGKKYIHAVSTASPSTAGTGTITASLPAGAIGKPRKLSASGNIAGYVALNISNTQQIVCLINPNAPPSVVDIPDEAFPSKTNSVSVSYTVSGAGFIAVDVWFEP
jgi:hypothetical protein